MLSVVLDEKVRPDLFVFHFALASNSFFFFHS